VRAATPLATSAAEVARKRVHQYLDKTRLLIEEKKRNLEKYTEAKAMAAAYTQMNKNNSKYKFAICSGNNSNIVRRCMNLR